MTATASTGLETEVPGGAQGLRSAAAVLLVAAVLSLQVFGVVWIAVGYLVCVLALVVAWAFIIDPPGRFGIAVIGALVALLVSGAQLSEETGGNVEILLAGSVLALVAAMVLQIARRPPRSGVVASLASATTLGMVVVAGALLIPLRDLGGRQVTSLFVGVVATTLIVGRLLDAVTARPPLRTGLPRGVLGLVVGLAAGIGVGALYAMGFDGSDRGVAFGIAVSVAVSAVVIDLVAAIVVAEHRRGLLLGAVLTAVIPVFVAAPAAELTARLLS